MTLDPFATVEQLGAALQRPDIDRDAATLALRRASGAIRGFCGWSVSADTVVAQTITMPYYSQNFWLPTLWLTSVTSLVEGGLTQVAGTHFAFTASGRVHRASGYWSVYHNDIVVSYTHGYPEGDDRLETVRDVCLSIAARAFGNPYGHSSETTGTESWAAGVSNSVATLTAPDMEQLAHLQLERL